MGDYEYLVAINPCVMDGTTKETLLVGKVYEVFGDKEDWYIIDEEDEEHYFTETPEVYFKPFIKEIRYSNG